MNNVIQFKKKKHYNKYIKSIREKQIDMIYDILLITEGEINIILDGNSNKHIVEQEEELKNRKLVLTTDIDNFKSINAMKCNFIDISELI